MDKLELIDNFICDLKEMGSNILGKDKLDRVSASFLITCVKCGSRDVAVIVDREGGCGCETCGITDPDDVFILKCRGCGNAIKVINPS
jgi:translation initiation factor 2 beta subunit (eIF-2beta)/eIF-5